MERAPLQAARKVVTVLVVEDDWMIRENMVTDLRQEGWAVLEAATGTGALKALQDAEKVDLLITDIGLADALSGWDVAEAFWIAHPEVPVIYASGNPANDHRQDQGERLSQQAGSRFRAYRHLPQASGAAGFLLICGRPIHLRQGCTLCVHVPAGLLASMLTAVKCPVFSRCSIMPQASCHPRE